MKTITYPECNGRGGWMDYAVGYREECPVCSGEGTLAIPTNQQDLDSLGIPASVDELDYGPSEDNTR
jgi:hypothetical protein